MLFRILTLVGINVIFFWRTLWYGYAVDDWEVCRCHCKKPDIIKIPPPPGTKQLEKEICRKCGILKRIEHDHWWEYLLWNFGGLVRMKGTEARTQYTNNKLAHSFTIILHSLNCVLIYLTFGINNISFLAAVMFAVHPTAMQGSSVWLCGKGYGLGLACSLLAWKYKLLMPIFYYLGSYFASTMVLPLMFIHTPYWYLVFFFPLGVWYRRKMLRGAIEYKFKMVCKTRYPFHWHNIILVFKTIGYYFCLCLVPVNLGVHHTYLSMYGITDKETKEALQFDTYELLGIILTVLMAYLFFCHWGPVALGLMWFFVFIMPWSNWMAAVNQPIGERYCVISLVGILYALANVIINYPIAQACFITYYVTVANAFLPAYRNILQFAVYNVHNFSDSFQGWLWKSDLERNFSLIERSFDSAMQAWCLRPDDFLVNNNIATLYLVQHKFKEAEPFLKKMEQAVMPTKELEEKKWIKLKSIRAQMKQDMEHLSEFLKQDREKIIEQMKGAT